MTERRIVNVDDIPLEEDGDGRGFRSRLGAVGPLLGSSGLGCTLTVVPPGKQAFPFHRHHGADEMFFILSGEGRYRLDDAVLALRAGDLVAAPAGAEAHQIVNTGGADLRYLAFSTMPAADVVEYPDSGKIGVRAGMRDGDRSSATFRARGYLTPADYYDGEGEPNA